MEIVLIIALFVQAIHYTMQEGEIFAALGDWFYKHLPKKIHQPVFDCPVCMTPWYGTAIYFILPGPESFFGWLVAVIPAMGLQAVIGKMSPDKDTEEVKPVDLDAAHTKTPDYD